MLVRFEVSLLLQRVARYLIHTKIKDFRLVRSARCIFKTSMNPQVLLWGLLYLLLNQTMIAGRIGNSIPRRVAVQLRE